MSVSSKRYYDPSMQHYIADGVMGLSDERAAVQFLDDFLGDTLSADHFAVDASTGASVAISETPNGVVRFATDTDDDDHATLVGALNLKLNTPGWLEVRLRQVTAATLRAVEVGLSDAKSEANGLAFASPNTPTAVATDAVVFGYNTDEDAHWHLLSVNNGMAQTTGLAAAHDAAADTWQVLRLEWDAAANVTFYLDRARVGAHAAAVRTTIPLCVWITLKSLSGAAKAMDVDYVAYAYDRA